MPTERRLNSRIVTALLLGLNLTASTGCFTTSFDEVARSTSPSGKLDAVLVETNGGATTSFGYLVYVVPARESTEQHQGVAYLYGASRSEQAYGVNLRWAGSSDLTVEYLAAREADLRVSNISVAGQQIRVSLKSGVSDPTAPPGGMLHNLQVRLRDR
jgi:hypothetical protein